MKLASKTPYRGEIGNAIKYLSTQVRKQGVKLVFQQEVTAALVRDLKPQVVIVATGSIPVIPEIPGAQHGQVVTAHEVLNGEVEVGPRVVVFGGRQIGVQTAEFLANQGKEVTIIEESSKIGRDITIFDVWGFRMRLSKLGVRVLTNSTPKEITLDGITVVSEKEEKTVPADTVVVAWKAKANKELWENLQGDIATLFAVGDCVAPRKAINAIHAGFRVGVQI